MSVIQNKWVEKQKKKREVDTAPAFDSNKDNSWVPVKIDKKIKRHTPAAHSMFKRTLRGVRK